MRHTFLAAVAIAIALPLGAITLPALAADAPCFPSIAAYAASVHGAAFAEDENIALGRRTYGRQLFDVVEDRTSGTNHPRTLLLARAGHGYCVVLTTPAVAQLQATMIDARGMPLQFSAVDQAAPGLPAHRILYGWEPADKRYAARKCSLIAGTGKNSKATPVFCEEAAP